MKRSSFGIHLPVKLERVIDADTLVVSGNWWHRKFRVRVKGVWCPENNTDIGKEASKWVDNMLRDSSDALSIEIEYMNTSILDHFSFKRILAYVWINDTNRLDKVIIEAKYGSSTRKGILGE